MTGRPDLGDLFGGAFGETFADTPLGQAAKAARKDSAKPAGPGPLPQLRGKRIDGVLYVRADDVADALDATVPGKATRLVRKLRGQL